MLNNDVDIKEFKKEKQKVEWEMCSVVMSRLY